MMTICILRIVYCVLCKMLLENSSSKETEFFGSDDVLPFCGVIYDQGIIPWNKKLGFSSYYSVYCTVLIFGVLVFQAP